MFARVLRVVVAIVALLPVVAAADPIKLKLSFFTSDRSIVYLNQIKPFVDAVNADGKGLVEIEVYFSGAISKVQNAQPELVTDGIADMALVVPGQTPEQFSDISVMELPGVFRDTHEASRIFTRLVATKALKGFDDYAVIGAFVSAGESIHSRKPLGSLADLNGQTIRVNNPIEAMTLEKLGAIPVLLAINQTMEKLSQDKIDGATVPPSMLFEFGIGRVTNHHYMMQLGGAPTALVMNRAKFESLPPQAQAIIRKYSDDWLSERSAVAFDAIDDHVLAQLKADQKRTVTYPSLADAATIKDTYVSVIDRWASSSLHNRELLTRVNAEIAKLRSNN
jgi:TRAP-type C4-dicarboxylate transport system substrate-binding protein